MSDNVFKLIYFVGLIAAGAVRFHYTRLIRKIRVVERRGLWAERPLMLLAWLAMQGAPLVYIFSPWLDFADYRLPAWASWIGAGLFAAMVLLLWKSHADLGLNWSPLMAIREEHRLVTRGVYRYIRHPMYAAHFLWAVAQPLLLHNWIAGPPFLPIFALIYFLRVPREEQMMLDHFGEAYRSYMMRTGRMIPRLRGQTPIS
ncbi:MAG: DUF1295 domain-containing protein [Gemmatimonadetes bacterium]|nr:DUF1295 domain-containing protein [Gemmatimonadota bacterium]